MGSLIQDVQLAWGRRPRRTITEHTDMTTMSQGMEVSASGNAAQQRGKIGRWRGLEQQLLTAAGMDKAQPARMQRLA